MQLNGNGLMDGNHLRSAVISTDRGFREAVRRALGDGDRSEIELAVEITVPFTQISEEQISELRRHEPELVIVDFDQDPETGINLTRFLTDGHPHRQMLAAGPALSTDLLLEAMRAGVAEYLPKPVTQGAMQAAVVRAARKFGWSPAARTGAPGKLYAFFSPKGGSGTTTLATNLAVMLQRLTNRKTLLVDLDLELGEAAVLLGVQPRFSFLDMVKNFHRMDAGLLASLIERHESGIHLLSAPFHPERTESVPGEDIRAILHFLKQHYDYVVVDTAKSFSAGTVAAFDEADRVFLVTHVDVPSLRNLQRCLPLFDQVVGKDRDRLKLIVNRYHKDDVISLDDVRRTVGLDVAWTISNDYGAVIRSINSATPIARDGNSRYSKDLQALTADLVGLRGKGTNGRVSRVSAITKIIKNVVKTEEGRS